jgi:signal peptidase I
VRKKTLTLGLVLTLVVGVGAAALAYRLFVMRLVRVPTGAMMNTILPGDRLVTNRLFGAIKRGWIVVFKYPGDSTNYIARVIGLPGETVEVRDRSVYVNGHMLEERRVLVKSDDLGEADVLEEVSTEGTGSYRVFIQLEKITKSHRYYPTWPRPTLQLNHLLRYHLTASLCWVTTETTAMTVVSAAQCRAS